MQRLQGCGIKLAYNKLAGDVRKHLKELKCSKVTVTGHSLGAAMAILALYDLSKDYELQTTYTFGQPGVGNTQFHDDFQVRVHRASVFRFVHGTDPIPLFSPLGSPEMEGSEVFLPNDSKPPLFFKDHECYLGWYMGLDTPGKDTFCDLRCNPDTDVLYLNDVR